MVLDNKFVIVIPTYNAESLIEKCLMSILSQNFDDLGVIIRDDISTDRTSEVVKNLLGVNEDKFKTQYMGKDVIYYRNDEKLYPLGNTYESAVKMVKNPNAVIGVVDGDDMLANRNAVKLVNDSYCEDENRWLVWSQHVNSNGTPGQSRSLPPDSVIYGSRNYWSVTHFRTSKVGLFHKLKEEDLIDPFHKDSYYRFSGDAAFLFPFIEMCGNEHSHFINKALYLYNNNLPTNEHVKDLSSALKYGRYIKSIKNQYSKLESL